MRCGVPLDLELARYHWGPAALVLTCLAEVDATLAQLVTTANREALTAGLRLTASHALEGLRIFLNILDQLSPGLIEHALADLDAQAVTGWATWLRRRGQTRQAVADLTRRTASLTGPTGQAAQTLFDRFPSIRHT